MRVNKITSLTMQVTKWYSPKCFLNAMISRKKFVRIWTKDFLTYIFVLFNIFKFSQWTCTTLVTKNHKYHLKAQLRKDTFQARTPLLPGWSLPHTAAPPHAPLHEAAHNTDSCLPHQVGQVRRVREVRKAEATLLRNLTLEGNSHHLCCILCRRSKPTLY